MEDNYTGKTVNVGLNPICKKTLFNLFTDILYDQRKELPDPDMYALILKYKSDLNLIYEKV